MGTGRTSQWTAAGVVAVVSAFVGVGVAGADIIQLPANGAGGGGGELQIRVMPDSMQDVFLPVVTRAFATDLAREPEIGKRVEELRSAQFGTREKAMDALMHLPADRLTEVTTYLEKEKDPEALERLVTVAGHLFLKARTPVEGTTAFMGVTFAIELVRPDAKNLEELRMAVRAESLQTGYPAAQELRLGDRIMGINGKPFSLTMSREDFVGIVREYKPGTVVRLEVLRRGEVVPVDMQLASLPANVADSATSAILQRDQALKLFLDKLRIPRMAAVEVRDTTPVPENPLDREVQLQVMPEGGILVIPRPLGN